MSGPAPALELTDVSVFSSDTEPGQVSSVMLQSDEDAATNSQQNDTERPLAPVISEEMRTGLARIGFHRLALGKDNLNISDATFDVKVQSQLNYSPFWSARRRQNPDVLQTAPGHMEDTYVGHHSWLASVTYPRWWTLFNLGSADLFCPALGSLTILIISRSTSFWTRNATASPFPRPFLSRTSNSSRSR